MKQKNNQLTLWAGIMSCVSIAFTLFAMLTLIFNWFGLSDIYTKLLLSAGDSLSEIDFEYTIMYIELSVNALINLYFARFYFRSYRFGLYGERHGNNLIKMGLVQLILIAFLPGLLGLIAGFMMANKKSESKAKVVPQNLGVSDLKMEAMKQACARLKELRDKGAISEEEYYASLNKILEG